MSQNTMTQNIQQPAKPEKKTIKHHIKANKHLSAWILLVVITLAVAGGAIYFKTMRNKINIEKAEISGTKIDLAAKTAGTLEEVMVKEGDVISADTIVARVGNTLIKADVSGTIIKANNNVGAIYAAGSPVVSMIQTGDLKVVGRLAEDKGLKDVKIGQTALFEVDAYSGKKYYGIVDEISPTSRDSGVAFNISDKRETKEFNIKIRFDAAAYPELKNGMSAKIWIYQE